MDVILFKVGDRVRFKEGCWHRLDGDKSMVVDAIAALENPDLPYIYIGSPISSTRRTPCAPQTRLEAFGHPQFLFFDSLTWVKEATLSFRAVADPEGKGRMGISGCLFEHAK